MLGIPTVYVDSSDENSVSSGDENSKCQEHNYMKIKNKLLYRAQRNVQNTTKVFTIFGLQLILLLSIFFSSIVFPLLNPSPGDDDEPAEHILGMYLLILVKFIVSVLLHINM